MGFRLFSLLALYKLDNDKGHIASAGSRMNLFFTNGMKLRNAIADQLDPSKYLRTFGCSVRANSETLSTQFVSAAVDDEMTTGMPSQWFQLHLAKKKMCGFEERGNPNLIIRDNATELQPVYDAYKAKYQKIKEDFLAVSGDSINKAVQCYVEICNLVGVEFSPPASYPIAIGQLPTLPSVVEMPGAIVRFR
jgi:hypothetical protein